MKMHSCCRLFSTKVAFLAAFFAFTCTFPPVQASDHADPVPPIKLKGLDDGLIGLNGLYGFVDGDRLVVMVNVGRELIDVPNDVATAMKDTIYKVHFDTHTPATFDNPLMVQRFGGSIAPEAWPNIAPDAAITFRIKKNSEGEVSAKRIVFQSDPVATGLSNPDSIQYQAGLFDDPFLFNRFNNKNTVAMIASIPLSSFAGKPRNFVMWATAHRSNGAQFDHVGRAGRTQQPRLDILNTLPPSKHVPAIIEERNKNMMDQSLLKSVLNKQVKDFINRELSTRIQQIFQIRRYDSDIPDVMILNLDRPIGYPNGNVPGDDVVRYTCIEGQGECQLWEIASFTDACQPRRTYPDKPLPNSMPYLGEPWTKQISKDEVQQQCQLERDKFNEIVPPGSRLQLKPLAK
ncbi:MAG: hypothetical protein ACR65R_00860 [Methylomicrobium sp.]